MMKKSQGTLIRSALAFATVLVTGSALAMPFCGNKGYKNNYRYAPAYAYPAVMPAYGYAPVAQPAAHSWNRGVQPAYMTPSAPAQTASAAQAPAEQR